MTIKILIADDHKIIRDGLRELVDQQADMEVVGEAENGRKAVRLTKELHPDVVIMDVTMPDMNGLEATRKIISAGNTVKVVALSMHSDRRIVKGMMDAGASGYLLKDCAFEELATAVRAVLSGKTFMSSGLALKSNGNGNKPPDP